MYCTNCGNKLNNKEKYCPYCGKKCQEEDIDIQKRAPSNNTSTILGILSCVFFMIPIISIPLAIISIVTGNNERKNTNKFATGIILGIISLLLTILMIAFLVTVAFFAIQHTDNLFNDYQIEKKIDENFFEKKDMNFDIKGYSWLGDDNSILYLNKDNTYIWYQQDNNHEDNYYQGKFKTYTGEDAIEYISTTLEEFGLTEEAQRSFFEEGKHELNEYYLIILTCEKAKMDGKETEGTDNTAYYYGFYSKTKKRLDLINMSTKNKAGFIRKEKLNNIDV